MNKILKITLLFYLLKIDFVSAINFENYIPLDKNNHIINAHGGQVSYIDGEYYLIGEKEGRGADQREGFNIFKSKDFQRWGLCGNVINPYKEVINGINKGDILERPRLIKNNEGTYFIYFHYEKSGDGYKSALVAIAKSKNICSGYNKIIKRRLPSNILPLGVDNLSQLKNAKYFRADFRVGQMSRDLNIYIDGNNGFLISSSENNSTIMIVKLLPDFSNLSNEIIRVNPGVYSEAPILFKINDIYYILASGTTGWKPNEIQLYSSDKIMGNWIRLKNPIPDQNESMTTFDSQGTSVFKFREKYIFLSDHWDDHQLSNSTYLWTPITRSENKISLSR